MRIARVEGVIKRRISKGREIPKCAQGDKEDLIYYFINIINNIPPSKPESTFQNSGERRWRTPCKTHTSPHNSKHWIPANQFIDLLAPLKREMRYAKRDVCECVGLINGRLMYYTSAAEHSIIIVPPRYIEVEFKRN